MKAICVIVCFLTVCSIYGQTNRFDVGIEGSPNWISLNGNEVTERFYEPSIGFSGGMFFRYNFKYLKGNFFSLRTELTFEKKGAMIKNIEISNNSGVVDNGNLYENFSYMTLPILLAYTQRINEKFLLYANGGSYLGYLVKQTTVVKGKTSPITKHDNTSSFKQYDIGFSCGFGASFPIKQKFTFSLELRNNLGLYNISKLLIINNGNIKTNSINLLFGFAYKFGARK
ncbi:MAG: PorT family protein [Bacteroidetes bacterium]|nr:PorT family protein [Bacteroidota bacterium]